MENVPDIVLATVMSYFVQTFRDVCRMGCVNLQFRRARELYPACVNVFLQIVCTGTCNSKRNSLYDRTGASLVPRRRAVAWRELDNELWWVRCIVLEQAFCVSVVVNHGITIGRRAVAGTSLEPSGSTGRHGSCVGHMIARDKDHEEMWEYGVATARQARRAGVLSLAAVGAHADGALMHVEHLPPSMRRLIVAGPALQWCDRCIRHLGQMSLVRIDVELPRDRIPQLLASTAAAPELEELVVYMTTSISVGIADQRPPAAAIELPRRLRKLCLRLKNDKFTYIYETCYTASELAGLAHSVRLEHLELVYLAGVSAVLDLLAKIQTLRVLILSKFEDAEPFYGAVPSGLASVSLRDGSIISATYSALCTANPASGLPKLRRVHPVLVQL